LLQVYIVLLCGFIFYEDMRYRAVHWSFLAQCFLCLGMFGLLTEGRRAFLSDMPVNLAFVALQVVGVVAWCSVRARQWVNPMRGHMGLGDVLFLLACALAFPRHVFVLFVLSGIVFALFGYGVIRLLMPRQQATVPTAGLLAVYLGSWMAMRVSGVIDLKA